MDMVCFNRYMVECEYGTYIRRKLKEIIVLIDTWWNVNNFMQVFNAYTSQVLIDTWWNVNINFSGKMAQMTTGFNRYMVECELKHREFLMRRDKVLIDTWWNVNILTPQSFGEEQLSFNRYMVECEYRKFTGYWFTYIVLIDTWWNVND